MNVVRTVLGDILSRDLGITTTHEHLICDQRLCADTDPGDTNLMVLREPDELIGEVGDFRRLGGRAIVEVTVQGWGRDVRSLAEISKRTGTHVVATSGYYIEPCMPAWAANASLARLTAALVRELRVGADGSRIRTGLLKTALSRPVLEDVELRCARAVARAQRLTGVAVTTHTSGSVRFHIRGGNGGHQFLDVFEEEGVDPSRVIIGHCDENADIRQLKELIGRGAYVQFDVIGKQHWLLDDTRADLLTSLIDAGHADRLLLASDRARRSELRSGGGKGYGHVLRDFLPRLLRRGVADADINLLLIENPARVLAFDALPNDPARSITEATPTVLEGMNALP